MAGSTTVPAHAGSTPEPGGEDTYQRRLALFAKAVFIIALGFYALSIVLSVALFSADVAVWATDPVAIAHASGIALMGLLWLVVARVRMSATALAAVEVVGFVGCCTAWAFMLSDEHNSADDVMLAHIVTVILRATIVPSTATRTLWMTALASVPLLVIQFVVGRAPVPGVPPDLVLLAQAIDVGLWLIAGTAIATFTSRVIYGLRRQVAEARDLGQYTLERKLGAGGMGEVWLARHRLLIREAAVKIIRPAALGAHPGAPGILLRRFEREARATASLKSPHTVQLYDFGIADDGTLYYVMELLDGMDLETMVTRYGPLPAERARELIKQACHSLAEAHTHGLIHRDIKPANLFVNRAGFEGDFVKVLDFGLVKLGTAHETSMRLTDAGTTTGTPAYMAPEVVQDREVDHRADLYALGCVGYFLLTGKLVFDADNASRMMLDHAQTKPRPPSSRTELPIPASLDDLIMACLAKNPKHRPQTAAELASRLEACEMPTAWTHERAERWWETHMPERESERPLADVLLSHEARPSLQVRTRRLGP